MSDQILKELYEIKTLMQSHISRCEVKEKQQDDKIQEHSWELWGRNGNPGIAKDVDRIKTTAGHMKWAVGTIFALVGERVWTFFKH